MTPAKRAAEIVSQVPQADLQPSCVHSLRLRIEEAIAEAARLERIRIASLLEHSADCMDEGAPRCTEEPYSASLRKLAASLRAG